MTLTVQSLTTQAREKIAAGDIAGAKALTEQAKALLDVEQTAAKSIQQTPQRLHFAPGPYSPAAAQGGESSGAMKMWYVKRFGTLDAQVDQIAKEVYGAHGYEDYTRLQYVKSMDFKRYLKYGVADPQISRMLVLTPDQLVEAAVMGMTVDGSDGMKATQMDVYDTLGGYIVPEDFRTTVIQRLPGLTFVRQHAMVTQTSSDRVLWPKATGGDSQYTGAVRVTWVDEAPTAGQSATNATWGNTAIPIHTVMAKTSLSRNQVEGDTAFPIEEWLKTQFTQAMAVDEDKQFLTGIGAGRPQGVLSGTAANGAPSDPDVQIQLTGGATISADSVVAAPDKLDAQYRQSGGDLAWVFNKGTKSAIRQLKDSNNRYLFSDNNNQLAVGQPSQLVGYSFSETESMPAIGSNKYPAIFGNWKMGYTIVDRIGMSVERYLDSQTADVNQVVYYARRRLGGQVTAGWAFVVLKCA
jgi:HK97 family phage major capsid protein